MDRSIFGNPACAYSVVMFIQEETLGRMRKDIEAIGAQKNVKFVVQPCPYEAIEFLYQADLDFPNGHASQEKELFWHALEFKKAMTMEKMNDISNHHHQFLVSILENDSKKVTKERKALESLIQKNS